MGNVKITYEIEIYGCLSKLLAFKGGEFKYFIYKNSHFLMRKPDYISMYISLYRHSITYSLA